MIMSLGIFYCLLSFLGGIICLIEYVKYQPNTQLERILKSVLLTLGIIAIINSVIFLIELIKLL
jgi:hypothetical protein